MGDRIPPDIEEAIRHLNSIVNITALNMYYRQMALLFHPDKHPGDPTSAHANFVRLKDEYDKRKEHLRIHPDAVAPPPAGAAAAGAAYRAPHIDPYDEYLSILFSFVLFRSRAARFCDGIAVPRAERGYYMDESGQPNFVLLVGNYEAHTVFGDPISQSAYVVAQGMSEWFYSKGIRNRTGGAKQAVPTTFLKRGGHPPGEAILPAGAGAMGVRHHHAQTLSVGELEAAPELCFILTTENLDILYHHIPEMYRSKRRGQHAAPALPPPHALSHALAHHAPHHALPPPSRGLSVDILKSTGDTLKVYRLAGLKLYRNANYTHSI